MLLTIVFAAVEFWLIQRAPKQPPTLTAYANGKAVEVEPTRYCSIKLEHCQDHRQTILLVPRGDVLQVSLPAEIADAPWNLVLEYITQDGVIYHEQVQHFSGPRMSSFTIPTKDQLVLIELQQPSALIDESGLPYARAYWSLRTL